MFVLCNCVIVLFLPPLSSSLQRLFAPPTIWWTNMQSASLQTAPLVSAEQCVSYGRDRNCGIMGELQGCLSVGGGRERQGERKRDVYSFVPHNYIQQMLRNDTNQEETTSR